jgi:selenocysteine-specific elongation factor
VRIREIQVHGTTVDAVELGGRTALNLAGVETTDLHRGMVLTADNEVVATDRILAAFSGVVGDRARGRVHSGTAAVDAIIGRAGRDGLTLPDGRYAGVVRLVEPIAVRTGDRFVFRRGAAVPPVGAVVLDLRPPRGISRRRQTPELVGALALGEPGARLALHGLTDGSMASDVVLAAEGTMLGAIGDVASVADARSVAARALRRLVTVRREEAAAFAATIVAHSVTSGRLIQDGETVRRPGVAGPQRDPAIDIAMDRLVTLLDVAAPPSLAEAARAAGCPPSAIGELERTGRIVTVESDLAYAATTYSELTARALELASHGPLTPATFRDATGTSRKYVMAILEDLDRRAILRRTPAGHVPGPKAPTAARR